MCSLGFIPTSLLKPYFCSHTSCISAKPFKNLMVTKTVEESDVGIVCYISHLPGFRGILKQRYSDFIVNEVDVNGHVVHLTSLEAPSEINEENEPTTSGAARDENYGSVIEAFRSLAGDSDAKKLESLLNQIKIGVEDSISPVIFSPDGDKAHRTAVHNFFKKNFKFLVTDTIDGPNASSKCIRIRLGSKGQNNKGSHSKKRKERGDKPFDSRGSDNWPEHMGKFLRFHLYKENKDTQEALGLIGKMLGIQPRSFGFAGTKDKRSVSTQRVTVFKQQADRLSALNDRLIGIKVGDFCYVTEEILLGQLLGNRFSIVLRGVVAESEKTIQASAEALGRRGFINYFGLQRFGTGSVPTYLVGATLLKGEWKAAVSMILDPRDGERDQVTNARKYYKESNDIEGTLKQLPRHLVAERAILQCLKKCPGNHLQALKAIPRTLRMIILSSYVTCIEYEREKDPVFKFDWYIHSYQSYLWNHAASLRVQKYGTEQIVEGDLVYCKEDCTEGEEVSNFECEEKEYNDVFAGNLDEISGAEFPIARSKVVKVVSAEDILSETYRIDDVILPLPGSKVTYPANDVTDIYHDLAKKDSISLTDSTHNVKEFSVTGVTGSYRRVFEKPLNFEWELLKYTDSKIALAETDLDQIAKSNPEKGIVRENLPNGSEEKHFKAQIENFGKDMELKSLSKKDMEGKLPHVEHQCGSDCQEPQTALKLSFTLSTSCYATMAIRELLKTSTSVAFHKTLMSEEGDR